MIAPDIGSTNTGSVTNVSETVNERAPLLSQRRLFRSLSGCPTLITSGPETGRTLGTFAGVFSPVALSMFSALLFLRVGFIVGNAGLLVTLLQFTIAYGILLFTVASVCAISTNGAVEGGGAYFMISRTLGPEFGGSIGSLFFLANVVSSALYITGCTEGLVENFGPSGYLVGENNTILPDGRWWRFLYCSVLNLLNLVVCLIGANMFAKTSVAILAIVCVCLMSTIVSFFTQGFEEIRIPDANEIARNTSGNYTGLSSVTLQDNLYPQYGLDYTVDEEHVHFAAVFGVLFSGVTGIMAGANMSGELRDPAKNIPRGTLSAVAFTFVCYIIVSLLTAASCSRYLLQNNFIFLMPINLWPGFVTIGILTATFSASLSNLIGSSRVLEALAKDDVFGYLLHFIVRGTRRGNPIAAVFVSWFLVELILIIGSLNVIAQINSVLFLLSYLATNLACLGLELASAPNFRPSFKYFTWHTALIGLVGTFVMMFIINTIYASSSIILCLILIIVLHVFSPTRGANWGSISQALIFHQVRKYLLLLDSRKDHVKFWRPQMLLMVVNPRSSCPLIDFVNDMKKGGLYVLGHVKVGNFLDSESDPTMEEYPHWLALVDHLKVKAFVELTMAKSVREGLHHLIRISGLGAMKPNTIVLGFYDDKKPVDFFEKESCFQTRNFRTFQSSGSQVYLLREEEEDKCLEASDYVAMVNDVLKMQKNICLCRHFNLLDKSMVKNRTKKYIDVWPINFFNPNDTDPFDTTSLFMLQLACIINMVPSWKSLRMRVFMCAVSMQTDVKKSEVRLEQLLQLLRIAADIHQVQWEDILTLWECEPEEVKTESNVHTIHYNIPALYLQRVNELIQQHSSNTAVTFIYLPHPPVSFEDEAPMYLQYLEHLTEITENLPPTVLVHGVSPVTSTTL